jgi:DNA-binding response OmpR family regulator
MGRILIVEDDPMARRAFMRGFRADGYTCEATSTVSEARQRLGAQKYAAVILDRMLPDGDGLAFCREIRAGGNRVPVLMVTALTHDKDVIEGLAGGADDYVGKPASLAIMRARLAALLRRGALPARVAVGELMFDLTERTLYFRTRDAARALCSVALTGGETRLVAALAERPDQVVSRAELLAMGWGEDSDVNDNALDQAVSRLRQTLGEFGRRLVTVRRTGWSLRSTDGESGAPRRRRRAVKSASKP